MAGKIPSIPTVAVADNATRSVLEPVRECIEIILGRRPGRAGERYVTLDELSTQNQWQDVTLVNSWVNYGTGEVANAAFYKDALGIVRLRGVITTGVVPSVAFVLPIGHRPAFVGWFPVVTSTGFGRVDVYKTGEVRVSSGGPIVSIDGIAFRV
jgi:hypothetical protein